MLQEDAPYPFYNRPVAARDHTHPVARPLAPVTFYTQILRFTQLCCTRQPPRSHSDPHTHPITHTSPQSQSGTASLPPRLSPHCSVTNHTPGCFLWPPSCQVPLQAHTVSHPKNYTHAETQLTLGQRRGSPATLTASRACRQVRTHRHTLMRPGTKGHTPVKHARGLPGGKNLTESASHVLGFRTAPTDALGGQDSGGPSRLAQPGQVPAVSSLSLPREGAGPRLRD